MEISSSVIYLLNKNIYNRISEIGGIMSWEKLQ